MRRLFFLGLFSTILVCTSYPSLAGQVPSEIEGAHSERTFIVSIMGKDAPAAFTDRWTYDPRPSSWSLKLFSKGASYDVPVEINEEVERFTDYFQGKGKQHFSNWLKRSGIYMPMIKGILREEGLPEDLAYLALIESGFSPHAISRAKAVGIWQFMSWTGKHNGLKINWWIDERKDPEKATRAAARHLKQLYGRFDSWYLAAASYNGGEGRIARAVARHGTDDFWTIASKRKALKRETKNYVPKFLAAMLIAKEPEKYGFFDITPYSPIAYDKVPLERATDIKILARAAETTTDEIKRLNPELLRWFTPPEYKGYEIKIPPGMGERFKENLAAIAPEDRLKFHTHRVRKGESLYVIARRYGTSIKEIAYLNDIRRTRLIREGSRIVVPVRERAGSLSRTAKARPTLPAPGVYTVQIGDTLWDISARYGVKLQEVLEWNGLRKTDLLRPGQKLRLREA